jgi:glucose-1-phosphate thymidylyltransferase
VQPSPDGLAQAFIIGEKFIGNDNVAMILGDNIFYGSGLRERLSKAVDRAKMGKATIFGSYVEDPERFGVIEFGEDNKAISLEEKPKKPKSNYAATGLYFYDNRVVEFAKKVKPSWRNELEITDLNNIYLELGDLVAVPLSRGFAWVDAGTPESMAEATDFIRSVEKHQGLKIACLEEIAFHNGWIDRNTLESYAKDLAKNDYGKYLKKVLEGRIRY